MAQGLVDFRNANVHFNPYNSKDAVKSNFELQKELVTYQNKIIDAAKRLDKKRNNIDTATMEFLNGYVKEKSGSVHSYIGSRGFVPRWTEITLDDIKKTVENI